MKIKTSVMLSQALLSDIDHLLKKNKSRSEFIEIALRFYIRQLQRSEQAERDIEIINRQADYLNRETEDALQYQVEW